MVRQSSLSQPSPRRGLLGKRSQMRSIQGICRDRDEESTTDAPASRRRHRSGTTDPLERVGVRDQRLLFQVPAPPVPPKRLGLQGVAAASVPSSTTTRA